MASSNPKFAGPGPDQIYLDHLRQQNFSLPKCLSCGEFHFFPRVVCPHCGSYDLSGKRCLAKPRSIQLPRFDANQSAAAIITSA